MSMSDLNYYTDRRVLVTRDENPTGDEITFCAEGPDGEEVEYTLPATSETCPTCCGRGEHVNPSVDAGGLSNEDFDFDPEFRADYFAGAYDVDCAECGGAGVVRVPDVENADPATLQLYAEHLDAEAEYAALCASERRWGA